MRTRRKYRAAAPAPTMKPHYTILVNSCDGFEDCWHPFFKLFSTYWPTRKNQILLNTEKKDWSTPDLEIACTRVQVDGASQPLSWSACLLRALNQVKTPLVLYLQEDYFIERPVNTALIDEFAGLMLEDETIKHIGLTHFGSNGPFEPTDDRRLWKIGPKARYRISTQAGLWRVETLKSIVRPDENGWMFEIFGTRRAWRRPELFLTANRDLYGPKTKPIIQYTPTGVMKGKWHPAMPALFNAHGISINFHKRGFYKTKHPIFRKMETVMTLASDPVRFLHGMRGR